MLNKDRARGVNIAEHHYIHGLENGIPNMVIVAEAISARRRQRLHFYSGNNHDRISPNTIGEILRRLRIVFLNAFVETLLASHFIWLT
jgi:hypothetical protein